MDWSDRERLGDGFYLEVTLPGDNSPTRLSPAQFRRQLRLQAEDTERRLEVAGNAEERQRERKWRRISSEPCDSRDGSSPRNYLPCSEEDDAPSAEEGEEAGRHQKIAPRPRPRGPAP